MDLHRDLTRALHHTLLPTSPRRRRRRTPALLTAVIGTVLATVAVAPAASAAAATPVVGAIAGTVTGTVPGGGTVPVRGVEVRIGATDTGSGTVPTTASFTTTTTATGAYRFPTVPAWPTYTVCFSVPPAAQAASSAGFVSHCHGTTAPSAQGGPTGTPVAVTAGRTTRVDDVLPAGAGVRGTVVDGGGRPVTGVTVRIDDLVDGGSDVTNAAGTYEVRGLQSDRADVCADPSEVPATATDPGAARTCVGATTALGAVTTVDVTLAPGGGLNGRLLDPAGVPVVGAAVRLSDPGAAPVTFTNGTGRWSVPHLTPGRRVVCFTPPADANLLGACAPAVTVRAGRYTGVMTTLATAAALTGTVTDTSGNPLQGVTVTVYPFDRSTPVSVVTGYDGRYRIVGRTPGTTQICFEPPQSEAGGLSSDTGYVRRCRTVTSVAGTTNVTGVLAAATTVSGRVTDETGQGVGGATVRLSTPNGTDQPEVVLTTTTSADGRYLLRNVPRGGFDVTAEHDEPGFGAPAGWIGAADGTWTTDVTVGTRPVTGVDLHLLRTAGVDITVTGPSLEPLTGVVVRLSTPGQSGIYTELGTDVDGRAKGAYRAGRTSVCAEDVAPAPGYPSGLSGACVVTTLRSGAVTPLSLVLTPADS